MALNRNNLKQTPIPVVSRTMQIVNTDGTVTRSGQLLLQQLQASEVLQGTHAGRPDPTAAPDGALYVESDRTVLYSNINGNWQYIAGTMWGTINPDQRPTDLGTHDAGFDFRTVDQPAREFVWSQAYWVEVTPVRYGTHAARLAVNVTRVIEQMLWVETDRTVLYQLMQVSGTTPVWQYIAGTMWGTMVPDQRPTDLGTHDAGFEYRTTDAPPREFIWSQVAWVETTPPQAGDVQFAQATGTLALTTAQQPIPGAAITLNRAGQYLITGNFYFAWINDGSSELHGQLVANGVTQPNDVLFFHQLNYSYGGATQQWLYRASAAGQNVHLTASKDGGTGSSQMWGETSITALWVSA